MLDSKPARRALHTSFLAGLLAVAAAALPSCAEAEPGVTYVDQREDGVLAPRPNIIFVLADDLGYGDVGAYGQTRIQTPHIDALAAQGMRFSQAYATAPVCAPSRCGLLTGLHTAHCAVDRNAYPNTPLRQNDVTVAELLHSAGYATGFVGKWGLGGELSDGTPFATDSTPNARGFDHFFGYLDQGLAHDYYPDWLWRNGQRISYPENANGNNVTYSHDLFTEDALDYVHAHANSAQPFYLQLSYTIPHRENRVPDLGPYAGESWPAIEKAFAAMVTRMDRDIGALMDALDQHGISNQTLVILSSDNGPHQTQTDGQTHFADFFDSNGSLRGNKRDLYEGGIREPFIARWPAKIPAGTVSHHVLGLQDFLPTAAELSGAQLTQPTDGISFAPTLTGTGTQQQHDYLYWSFWETNAGPGETPARYAVRRGEWKLIQKASGGNELYDLATDPSESHDLASARPDIVLELLTLIQHANGSTPGSHCVIDGTDGADVIDGTYAGDEIRGLGGDDQIRGLDNDDVINGNMGNDKVNGNKGRDVLYGGKGDDEVHGGQGDDEVFGDLGNDRLYGDLGNDRLTGGDGNDELSGGDGDDRYILDGLGADRIEDSSGNDVGECMSGVAITSDQVDGSGTRILTFSTGGQVQVVGNAIEALQGCSSSPPPTSTCGGHGFWSTNMCTCDPGYGGGDCLSCADGWQPVGATCMPAHEVNGTGASESIDGTSGDDMVWGLDGDDNIRGLDGNDAINGNKGNDVVNGNKGRDEVRGGQGDDEVRGGADDDVVYGDLGNDQVYGDLGNDRLIGGDGNDELFGGDGDDHYMVDGLGTDYVVDTSGNDTAHCLPGVSVVGDGMDGSGTRILQLSTGGELRIQSNAVELFADCS